MHPPHVHPVVTFSYLSEMPGYQVCGRGDSNMHAVTSYLLSHFVRNRWVMGAAAVLHHNCLALPHECQWLLEMAAFNMTKGFSLWLSLYPLSKQHQPLWAVALKEKEEGWPRGQVGKWANSIPTILPSLLIVVRVYSSEFLYPLLIKEKEDLHLMPSNANCCLNDVVCICMGYSLSVELAAGERTHLL